MAQFDMKDLARRGAQVRITELQQELESIYSAFPDLRQARRAGRANGGSPSKAAVRPAATAARPRPVMTAAQRKAVSERMRKYWAERRKAKAR